jgi:hypothetical protein
MIGRRAHCTAIARDVTAHLQSVRATRTRQRDSSSRRTRVAIDGEEFHRHHCVYSGHYPVRLLAVCSFQG